MKNKRKDQRRKSRKGNTERQEQKKKKEGKAGSVDQGRRSTPELSLSLLLLLHHLDQSFPSLSRDNSN
ncbi:hypothetical protein SESBI_10152 [Sesbania bispinosa]|nr:hypothetical protein SESBI_10152 [Sesbania bispinosa]